MNIFVVLQQLHEGACSKYLSADFVIILHISYMLIELWCVSCVLCRFCESLQTMTVMRFSVAAELSVLYLKTCYVLAWI